MTRRNVLDRLAQDMVTLATAVNLFLFALVLSGNAAAQDKPLKIISFGDSLSAGYGLPPASSFPARMTARLKGLGRNVLVVNASVSGDTTSAGLSRLDWAVPADAEAVIVELGANDALRGLPPTQARQNLDAILERLTARGSLVLVAGMQAPRNLGPEYAAAFDGLYRDLAAKHGALLYPFFLEGVALRPELNLADGIHPNERGIAVIVDGILPRVLELIDRAEARRRKGAQR